MISCYSVQDVVLCEQAGFPAEIIGKTRDKPIAYVMNQHSRAETVRAILELELYPFLRERSLPLSMGAALAEGVFDIRQSLATTALANGAQLMEFESEGNLGSEQSELA